jgi:hypothetical protein
MLRPPQSSDGCWSAGLIALAEARFCVECELIFCGHRPLPRCGGAVVWPLAQWLSRPPAAEPATAAVG